jgi:hypothetical protein
VRLRSIAGGQKGSALIMQSGMEVINTIYVYSDPIDHNKPSMEVWRSWLAHPLHRNYAGGRRFEPVIFQIFCCFFWQFASSCSCIVASSRQNGGTIGALISFRIMQRHCRGVSEYSAAKSVLAANEDNLPISAASISWLGCYERCR